MAWIEETEGAPVQSSASGWTPALSQLDVFLQFLAARELRKQARADAEADGYTYYSHDV